MLMAKAAAVVSFPLSEIITQNVPGSTVTVICGVDPAVAFGVELVTLHDDVSLVNVPMANPTATGEEALKVVSVTLMEPACKTVNEKTFEPCTANVPENISVGVGVVGDVGLSSMSPHPASRADRAKGTSLVPNPRPAYDWRNINLMPLSVPPPPLG